MGSVQSWRGSLPQSKTHLVSVAHPAPIVLKLARARRVCELALLARSTHVRPSMGSREEPRWLGVPITDVLDLRTNSSHSRGAAGCRW